VNGPDLRDLPGLRQWGDELREATGRAEDERRRARGRRRWPVRRLGVAVVAMFVLVPGAVATRSIWDNPVQRVAPLAPQPATPAVRLTAGRSSDVTWRLGGYDGPAGQRCLQFDTTQGGRTAGRHGCAEPRTRAGLTLATAGAEGIGFVFGTAADGVRSVEVAVAGGRRVRVATVGVSPEAVRRSGMRGTFRAFVAPFRGGFPTTGPPTVVGYDAAGRTVGERGAR
jgi:hypothetical protein